MVIQHLQEEHKGEFVFQENEKTIGKMTYSKAGDSKIIIDHTIVNSEHEGKGIGKQLLNEAVDFARKNSLKIIPLCPFAKATFQRNPEIQDVLF